jgi:FtsH-binding integral membrane protein
MATATAPITTKQATVLPGRRYDHYFFSGVVLLMLGLVVAGFGPSYYFAGVFRSSLPSTLIHVHGAVFSGWMLLLIAQSSLVSMGRVDIHKRLGIAGMFMAGLMLILGVLAATDSLARPPRVPGRDPLAFYSIPLVSVAAFAALMYFAFRERRNSPAHKRLVLVANVALMTAAIARLPLAFVHRKAPIDILCGYAFLLLLIAYDLWSTRKLQRATLGAAAFLATAQWSAVLFSRTLVWHGFAGAVQRWAQAHLI